MYSTVLFYIIIIRDSYGTYEIYSICQWPVSLRTGWNLAIIPTHLPHPKASYPLPMILQYAWLRENRQERSLSSAQCWKIPPKSARLAVINKNPIEIVRGWQLMLYHMYIIFSFALCQYLTHRLHTFLLFCRFFSAAIRFSRVEEGLTVAPPFAAMATFSSPFSAAFTTRKALEVNFCPCTNW